MQCNAWTPSVQIAHPSAISRTACRRVCCRILERKGNCIVIVTVIIVALWHCRCRVVGREDKGDGDGIVVVVIALSHRAEGEEVPVKQSSVPL